MKDIKLYITVGIPGSGKSTYSKEFARENNIKYLSSDELRAKFGTGEEDQSVTSKVFSYIKTEIDRSLKDKESVLIDSTAISKKNRRDFIDIAKKYDYVDVIALVFWIEKEVAKSRNKQRIRNVPEFVIDRMYKNFEMPSKNEGFDKIIRK